MSGGIADPIEQQIAVLLDGWERDGFGRFSLRWRDGAPEVVSCEVYRCHCRR